MVQRFKLSAFDADPGQFVQYHDYAVLEAENARLKEALRECVAALKKCACLYCQPDSDLCIERGYQPCYVITAITKAREVLGVA